jgi:hypothetical protein
MPGRPFQGNPPGGGPFGARLCRSSVKDRCGYSPSSLLAWRQNASPQHAAVFMTSCIISGPECAPAKLVVTVRPERGIGAAKDEASVAIWPKTLRAQFGTFSARF